MIDPFYHFGDPCIHCGTPQDDVAPGPCTGDRTKARVLRYCSLGVRYDGVERFRYATSDGTEHEAHAHVSTHAPYYHFGRSDDLINPPRYDQSLERGERRWA